MHYKAWARKNREAWASDGATFSHDRFQGEQINDNDLGAYYAAIRNDPCVYCGEPSSELDHIDARANGGHNYWTNLAPICSRCNAQKQARSVLNFLLAKPLLDQVCDLKAELAVLGPSRPGG